eukprot:scaffold54537_cov27-Tisochrysis_lutea.AAC.2
MVPGRGTPTPSERVSRASPSIYTAILAAATAARERATRNMAGDCSPGHGSGRSGGVIDRQVQAAAPSLDMCMHSAALTDGDRNHLHQRIDRWLGEPPLYNAQSRWEGAARIGRGRQKQHCGLTLC